MIKDLNYTTLSELTTMINSNTDGSISTSTVICKRHEEATYSAGEQAEAERPCGGESLILTGTIIIF